MVCGRMALRCTDGKHTELHGVVLVHGQRICAECTRNANTEWAKASRLAVKGAGQ